MSSFRAANLTVRHVAVPWITWSLTAFYLASGRPLCQGKINCIHYKALMSVWNSSKSEKVLAATSNQPHGLTLRDVYKHPITLNNLFSEEQIGEGMYHYKTFSGQYLSVDDRGHLTIKQATTSEVASFLPYHLPNSTADVYFMCAFVVDMETRKNFSYLVSPFKPAVHLDDRDCSSFDQFIETVFAIVKRGVLDPEKPSLQQEDYHFLHVHVTEPLTAQRYLSKELQSLCLPNTANRQ